MHHNKKNKNIYLIWPQFQVKLRDEHNGHIPTQQQPENKKNNKQKQ